MKSEVRLVMNTNEGQVSFKTDKITGELCSLILDSDDKISILIESEYGYLIFKKAEIHGIHCLAIRNKTIASEESMLDMTSFDKYYLNESLIITIMGPKNKEVGLIFRIE